MISKTVRKGELCPGCRQVMKELSAGFICTNPRCDYLATAKPRDPRDSERRVLSIDPLTCDGVNLFNPR